MNDNDGPKICMNRDINALNYILERIFISEPSAVVGMTDLGKDIIYNTLIEKIKLNEQPFELIVLLATKKADLEKLLPVIRQANKSLLVAVNMSLKEDVSDFIIELDNLRLQKSTKLNCVIISDLKSVTKALEDNIKILNRSLFILNPATKSDSIILLNDFEKRFQFILNDAQRNELYELSTGYIGLLKSLFLLRKDYPQSEFTFEFLLNQGSIIFRLKKLLADLSDEKLKILLNTNYKDTNTDLLDKFGFTKNGDITNKLLKKYLQLDRQTSFNAQKIFTKNELTVFNYLQEKPDLIISREVLAEILWQKETEEKYSDWAIDQLMHKIREKLKQTNSPYHIITKKGQGFIMISDK